MYAKASLLVASLSASLAHAVPQPRAAPTVTLDDATVVGLAGPNGTTNQFLGLRFAEPVNGTNRFHIPILNPPYTGTIEATSFGLACTQQNTSSSDLGALGGGAAGIFGNTSTISPSGEDCLFINVIQPAGATAYDKLPVVVWHFGGGFEFGDPDPPTYDGNIIVDESISMGSPIIYVSLNYRLNGFGFLASQEVKDARVGNLGLQDQRLALRWVQKYISNFGGDPTKVTIWGESAGAISVALQMVTNGGDTEGLFRAGFMESGSPTPVGDITHGQKFYDFIVLATGCSGSSNTLQCLREVDFDSLLAAINQTPSILGFQSLNLAWQPRVDGVFLTAPPQHLVQQGSVADIPFINGDCDDEGTLFTLTLLNLTTDAEALAYVQSNYLPNATAEDIAAIAAAYPDDPAAGSPFDTGDLNAITPQFKRLAALQGDLVFQAPRRFFIQSRSGKQKIFTYDNKLLKDTPIVGSAHGTDILNIFHDGTMTPYLINFVVNLDPNGEGLFEWPAYTKENPNMLIFQDAPLPPIALGADTFREEGIALLTNLALQFPL